MANETNSLANGYRVPVDPAFEWGAYTSEVHPRRGPCLPAAGASAYRFAASRRAFRPVGAAV